MQMIEDIRDHIDDLQTHDSYARCLIDWYTVCCVCGEQIQKLRFVYPNNDPLVIIEEFHLTLQAFLLRTSANFFVSANLNLA
jgi:hypothetical protein